MNKDFPQNKLTILLFITFCLCYGRIEAQDNGKIRSSGYQSLDYLYQISGKAIVSGIHNREPNTTPSRWTDQVFNLTGDYPGLWSGDFLFQEENINSRKILIDEAARQWKQGAMVQLMWHACNPALKQPCGWDSAGVLSRLTNEQWKLLTTDGTQLNLVWKQRVDEICNFLNDLQLRGVEVLWRPMHEMNQSVFWWGGRPGPEGTVKLFQMLHEYMTTVKGLHNLIWVWDMQDFNTLSQDLTVYNPGSSYWDVAALDIYDRSGFTQEKYDLMMAVAEGRPMGIGECDHLPSPDQLKKQPGWSFFMGWSELVFSVNSSSDIKSLYHSPFVITLDQMPGWK